MKPPEGNDPLDALLREQEPYIEDGGFTARVMTALPRRMRHFALRMVLLLGFAALGSVLAIRFLPGMDVFPSSKPDLLSQGWQTLLWLMPFLVIAASVTWGVLLAVQEEE